MLYTCSWWVLWDSHISGYRVVILKQTILTITVLTWKYFLMEKYLHFTQMLTSFTMYFHTVSICRKKNYRKWIKLTTYRKWCGTVLLAFKVNPIKPAVSYLICKFPLNYQHDSTMPSVIWLIVSFFSKKKSFISQVGTCVFLLWIFYWFL